MLGNPDLVIIDVRTEKEWRKSDKKISGATWEDADEFASWAAQYPKDKTMVLYCS
jgi:rhodanese-related sulfurtransferase